MAWILAKFFFFLRAFIDRDGVEVHPTIFAEQAWSIKDLLYDFQFGDIYLSGHDG